MKKIFSKIISGVLLLCLLISLSTVFIYADDTTGEAGTSATKPIDDLTVYYNRDFEEGWGAKNGFNDVQEKSNDLTIDYETTFDLSYNYFMRLSQLNNNGSLMRMKDKFDVVENGAFIVEMDLMIDDICNLQDFVQFYWSPLAHATSGASAEQKGHFLSIYDDVFYPGDKKGEGVKMEYGKWMHVTMILDFGTRTEEPTEDASEEEKAAFRPSSLKVYYGYEDDLKVYDPKIANITNPKTKVSMFAFHVMADATAAGESVCIDNLKIYSGPLTTQELKDGDYGKNVDSTAVKEFDIIGGGTTTEGEEVKGASTVYMKKNTEWTLANGVREAVVTGKDGSTYGMPIEVNGVLYIPFEGINKAMQLQYYLHDDGKTFTLPIDGKTTVFTVGRTSATVLGERAELKYAPAYAGEEDKQYLVIAYDDVLTLFPSWNLAYDEMGLIGFSNEELRMDRKDNLWGMVEIMKKFIYDYEAYENIYEDVKEHTNNFDHPYLLANQEKFDQLREVYQLYQADLADDGEINSNYDADGNMVYDVMLAQGLTSNVGSANNYVSAYAILYEDGTYKCFNEAAKPVNSYYLTEKKVQATDANGKLMYDENGDPIYKYEPNPDYSPDGYDPYGGRLSVPVSYLPFLAIAYHMTLDPVYAYTAYDYCMALNEWPHWAPAHFLNCADASYPFALSFDWLYDAYEELGLGADNVAEVLYTHGPYQGYLGCHGVPSPHQRKKVDASSWNLQGMRSNNWNAVCSSGMAISSLAILQYDEFDMDMNDAWVNAEFSTFKPYMGEAEYTNVRERLVWLLNNNMNNLTTYGLDCYAPDGSYMESASYWAYGTNSFFRMCAALESAAGDDYGLMDTWGMDQTCYFAMHIESSDFEYWTYHDCGFHIRAAGNAGSGMDHTHFFYVGQTLGDDVLIASAINRNKLRERRMTDFMEILYYPINDSDSYQASTLPLTYSMYNIQGFVTRASWEKGAIYTGVQGGENAPSHGHYDSGAFIYYARGIQWFTDLGSDDYNTYNWMGNPRHFLKGPEGHNVALLTSRQSDANMKYGQPKSADSQLIEVYENEYGAYGILDTSSQYGGYTNKAQRGVMMTNDRKTVIVQDELSFELVETVWWLGHTCVSNIEIDPTGKIAYMKVFVKGEQFILRASIVSPIRELKFQVLDTYNDLLLDATYRKGESVADGGGVDEKNRDQARRLAIQSTGYTFNCAVVLELIEDTKNPPKTGYKFTYMEDWVPGADSRVTVDDAPPSEGPLRSANPAITEIRTYAMKEQDILKTGLAYTDSLAQFYRAITDVEYAWSKWSTTTNKAILEQYEKHKLVMADYNKFIEATNSLVEANGSLAKRLIGIEIIEEAN